MYLWGSLKQVLCPDKQVLTGTVPAIHGLRITLKTGEVIDLMDEIELFAWSNTK